MVVALNTVSNLGMRKRETRWLLVYFCCLHKSTGKYNNDIYFSELKCSATSYKRRKYICVTYYLPAANYEANLILSCVECNRDILPGTNHNFNSIILVINVAWDQQSKVTV